MSHVIWFTGISGSGKSTLAKKTRLLLLESYPNIQLLDGDEVRAFFENDLGYTRSERMLNVRRIAFAAKLLSEHQVLTLVANIAPYYEARDFIRHKISNYIQIYCNASLERVRHHDVKGVYKANNNAQLIGVEDPYDEPRHPDLVCHTDTETVPESMNKIQQLLKNRGIL